MVWTHGNTSKRIRRRREIKESLVADAIAVDLKKKAAKLVAEKRAWNGWKSLQVAKVVDETHDCKSFYLVDTDQIPLPPFRPGQYLTVACPSPDGKTLNRCYSLSDAPDCRYLRITVKRVPGGKASNWLHDKVAVGHELQVRAPAGMFVPNEDERTPLNLIAAGIGVTPMVAIARYYQRVQPDRFVQLFYQVRNLEQAPLLKPLAKWAADSMHARLHLFVSSQMVQRPSWVAAFGRIDTRQILERCEKDELGIPQGQFMICGPDAMQESLRSGLLAVGVPSSRIAVEGFDTVRRTNHSHSETHELNKLDRASLCKTGHPVLFAKSSKQGQSSQSATTVLEVAEEAGVPAESGCRNGDCGACLMKLLNGRIRYEKQPTFGPLADNEILACVALPDGPITLDS